MLTSVYNKLRVILTRCKLLVSVTKKVVTTDVKWRSCVISVYVIIVLNMNKDEGYKTKLVGGGEMKARFLF